MEKGKSQEAKGDRRLDSKEAASGSGVLKYFQSKFSEVQKKVNAPAQ